MRGYNRQKADLGSYATPSKSREQVAEHIAAGHPSDVSYQVEAGAKLPVNLMRAPIVEEAIIVSEKK